MTIRLVPKTGELFLSLTCVIKYGHFGVSSTYAASSSRFGGIVIKRNADFSWSAANLDMTQTKAVLGKVAIYAIPLGIGKVAESMPFSRLSAFWGSTPLDDIESSIEEVSDRAPLPSQRLTTCTCGC